MKFEPMLSKKNGQALIIILLVMAVSLTLGVSVASRAIATLRQVSFSAQSAQALAFAEAGVEEALKCLDDGSCSAPLAPGPQDLNGDEINDFDYTISAMGPANLFDGLPPLERDTAVEVDLVGYPADTSISFYWVDTGISGQLSASSGLELTLIYCADDGPTCTTGNYEIVKVAYDTNSSRPNGIPKIAAGEFEVGGKTYAHQVTISPPGGKYPIALRFKVLYATSAVSVAVQAAGGAILPYQGDKIESTGFSGEVRRKVEVVRTIPLLSELFDFAIFSGSQSNPLSK